MTKELINKGIALPIMETFYSLQGEGYHTGKPSFFMRIGGCDVGCYWCDVKESWNAELHPVVHIDTVVQKAVESQASTVVITGGEPLTYNLEPLTQKLKENNFNVHIETSGTEPLKGFFDWICLSPKKHQNPLPQFYEKADELKIIIHQKSDFDWAELNKNRVKNECKLFLQPEWSVAHDITKDIISYIKKNTEWTLSLQTHKQIGIP